MTGHKKRFHIELEFIGGNLVTEELRKVFYMAVQRWEQVIVGTISGISLILHIKVSILSIDGPGRVLGRAGPITVRIQDGLPIKGIMEFDISDIHTMQRQCTIQSVILHEMGHVLGIGTLWNANQLIINSGTNNPQYIGMNGMKEYGKLLGKKHNKLIPIPIANTGGIGTEEGHWRENIFNNELMTGYTEEDPGIIMPLSRITIASLTDLSYRTNLKAADEYILPNLHRTMTDNTQTTSNSNSNNNNNNTDGYNYCNASRCPTIKVAVLQKSKRPCFCC